MQPSSLILAIGQKGYSVTDAVRIGRDPACQITLDDPLASRLHATVWLQNGAAFVRDENSSNGPGTLTMVIGETGNGVITVDWTTDLWDSVGTWAGLPTS
jgi:hypothetical protein